jgi:ATP-binding cassette subfamily B protein
MPRMGAGGKPKNFKASLRQLLRLLRPHLKAIIFSVSVAIIAAILTILGPSFIEKLTNKIFVDLAYAKHSSNSAGVKTALKQITNFGIILGSFYLTSFICSFIQSWIMAKSVGKVAKKLRSDITDKINSVPLNYFDTHQIGDTLSRITNDVDTIDQSLNNSIVTIFTAFITFFGVLIAMFISC